MAAGSADELETQIAEWRAFVRRGSFSALERWQTSCVPVYAVWAAFVVIVFPAVFDYV